MSVPPSEEADVTRVIVVGLGIMGGAIARHLAQAGITVFGHDPDGAACERAAAGGVTIVESFADLAGRSPVVLSSLPSADAVLSLAEKLASLSAARCTLIEMSTLPLAEKLQAGQILDRGGHIALDCPISGTGAQMAVKDVVVYASGPAGALNRWLPLLATFSRRQFDLGAYGNGSRVKLVANLLVAIHNVATAEALGLGLAAGIDPATMIDAICSGAANSRIFELRAPLIVEGRFEPPTMKLSVWAKDMAAIAAFSGELGQPTPLFDAVRPLYAQALADGHGELDTAAVALMLKAARPPSADCAGSTPLETRGR